MVGSSVQITTPRSKPACGAIKRSTLEPKWHDKGATSTLSRHMSESTYMSLIDKWLNVSPPPTYQVHRAHFIELDSKSLNLLWTGSFQLHPHPGQQVMPPDLSPTLEFPHLHFDAEENEEEELEWREGFGISGKHLLQTLKLRRSASCSLTQS